MNSLDESDLGTLMTAVSILKRRLRETSFATQNLSWNSMAVLARLDREGAQSVATLARAEHMRSQSMAKIVDELFEHQLVLKRPHPEDGRQSLLSLTQEGRAVRAASYRQKLSWMTGLIEKLPPEDQEKLRAAIPVLAKLVEL